MFGDLINAGASLLGAKESSDAVQSANKKNLNFQRNMARNQIQWKAADAKLAGLHPLAALGAQGMMPTIGAMADTSMGEAISEAGARIGNAVDKRAAVREQAANNAASRNAANAQAEMYKAEAAKARSEAQRNFIEMSRQASEISRSNQTQRADGQRPTPQTIYSPAGDFDTGPYTPAEKVENEYGDIVGPIYGVGRVAREGYDAWRRTFDATTKYYWDRATTKYPSLKAPRRNTRRGALNRR